MKTAVLSAGIACALAAGNAAACIMEPVQPPPTFWVINAGDTDGDGMLNTIVAQEVTLFLTGGATNCSCGLGFDNIVPPGLEVDSVRVEIWDKVTGNRRAFAPFDALQRSVGADSAYQSLRDGTGETWFSFAGLIPTIPEQPLLGPNEVIKIVFDIDSAVAFVGGLVVGAGEGTPDGLPQTTGPHAVNFFRPLNNVVPTPGSIVTASLAMVLTARRRRRA